MMIVNFFCLTLFEQSGIIFMVRIDEPKERKDEKEICSRNRNSGIDCSCRADRDLLVLFGSPSCAEHGYIYDLHHSDLYKYRSIIRHRVGHSQFGLAKKIKVI